ncbi:hypothetical protein [Streptomyces sp. 7-21]|uniref:hypothetical protein n=1 Tax=Streptomyces sp. 7-21 TaxID=2802283 RepID=UPI00191E6E1F|nr:hypothetical protein [Streptomyces sp. 7-21]MBL1066501.1 hypothetical protein [Streptomyces sp. 7-21]
MTSANLPHEPLTPRPLQELPGARSRLMTTQELRAHGVTTAAAHARCRPGGPWQMPLPGVYLLHAGPPTGEERLQAVLRYTGGERGGAVLSGLAALALHGFTSVPPLSALNRVDVLVPRTRRLRSAGCAHVVRTHRLPSPVWRGGFPVAPAERALADAVAASRQAAGWTPDALAVRGLLTEAVRGGFCEPHAVVRELMSARLLGLPQVASTLDVLLAEGRASAEERLMSCVRDARLPDPCWNVELWLSGGTCLGAADAYWPEHAVAVEIDTRLPGLLTNGEAWAQRLRRRERLEALGVTVVAVTPRALRQAARAQAELMRQALVRSAAAAEPPVRLVVLPR